MNAGERDRLERALEDIPTFDDNSIKHITCSNCNKRLMDIIKNDAIVSARKTLLRVECPFCKDTSFQQEVNGEFWMGEVEGVAQADIEWLDLEVDELKKVKNCTILVKTRKV
jgi:C4-type Zn-finger protein